MYKPARHRKKKLMAEINVVPYIDVMLVLLVIFMVTAPLLTEGVKVDLVQADAKQIDNTEQEPVVLTVDKDGAYFIDKEAKEPQRHPRLRRSGIAAQPQCGVPGSRGQGSGLRGGCQRHGVVAAGWRT